MAKRLIFISLLLLGCSSNNKDSSLEQSAACAESTKIKQSECSTLNCLEAEPLTCTYGDFSVDGDDCGCFTVGLLYEELCNAGITDSKEELVNGVSCQ